MKTVRCAIYTRKSSDEGLDQAFNSLDAQRESCAAYILSQASEGWTALPDIYDDGGLSGGTLERPALQRLLAEVQSGKVDIIVVYKVDRLTRSLFDFAKLVETFDKAGTSFVSVTQSFNTTTSMGRLTLNMLLSFAQFEREVTAERIRDKIAASKAKGMWMGGTPPLGYAPDGRSLKIVDEHAALVRDIFERYLTLGSVRLLQETLRAAAIRVPVRTRLTGTAMGGGHFCRGQLYTILRNATYCGLVVHKGETYAGLHPAILDPDTWDAVQARMDEQRQGTRERARAANPSLLAGLIEDGSGEPLIATHANKGPVRYRYYVSRSLNDAASAIGLRIPALEIEKAVASATAKLFGSSLDLIGSAWLQVTPFAMPTMIHRAEALSVRLGKREREIIRVFVRKVTVHDGRIDVTLDTSAIAASLEVQLADDAPTALVITSDVRLTRSGRALRLVKTDGRAIEPAASPSMGRLLAQAHAWWKELRLGALDITSLAKREGVSAAWMTRVVRLAFLSPALARAILDGTAPANVTAGTIIGTGFVQADWKEQGRAATEIVG